MINNEFEAPRVTHLILWLIIVLIGTLIGWAAYFEIDEVARGDGKVIPSSQIQVIQNLEGGILEELLVKEGDIVEKDQVLLRINDTRFSSPLRESQSQRGALQAKIARLTAEAEHKEFVITKDISDQDKEFWKNEQSLFLARQQGLQATVNILEQQKNQKSQEIRELKSKQSQLEKSRNLVQQELKITRPLVKQGIMSEVELLRLERQANDIQGEMETTRLGIPRIEAALEEVKRKIEEAAANFRSAAQSELNENKAKLSGLSESNVALEDRVKRTAVRSPVRGTVKQIKVNTVGGVVQPGMDLLEIVPLEDNLLIEAKVRPSDIAFLHSGQAAMIKFSAYDFSIYGGLTAKLEHISADSITNEKGEPFFLIRLRTDKNYLGNVKHLPIIPGMITTVDILTGRKTILDFLMKPLNKIRERAFRER
jgi:membrane fusion protein, adhesin transport system